MDQLDRSSSLNESEAAVAPPEPSRVLVKAASALITQAAGGSCGCSNPQGSNALENGTENGSGNGGYVYAIGRIEVRFPTLGLEKEFAQAVGRGETGGMSDKQAFHGVLIERRNRYLARQLCWVLTIEGIETYLIVPRDPTDYDSLLESIRPTPTREDTDVVIGIRGPVAPAQMCNGLMLPLVAFDQIYSFDTESLLRSIPRPDNTSEEDFMPRARDVFNRIIQVADNAGATDEHRALNYLATRYPDIYARASDAFANNYELAQIDVQPSRLSASRRIVTVIFTFNPRLGSTGVFYGDQYFVRVDVTEEFPFLVTPLQRGFIR